MTGRHLILAGALGLLALGVLLVGSVLAVLLLGPAGEGPLEWRVMWLVAPGRPGLATRNRTWICALGGRRSIR